jgi:hypothetical protein
MTKEEEEEEEEEDERREVPLTNGSHVKEKRM